LWSLFLLGPQRHKVGFIARRNAHFHSKRVTTPYQHKADYIHYSHGSDIELASITTVAISLWLLPTPTHTGEVRSPSLPPYIVLRARLSHESLTATTSPCQLTLESVSACSYQAVNCQQNLGTNHGDSMEVGHPGEWGCGSMGRAALWWSAVMLDIGDVHWQMTALIVHNDSILRH